MTDFFSIFQPGMQYVQEQRDLDKVFVVEAPDGAPAPPPLDADSVWVTLDVPGQEDLP